jgi:hypothetical protein
MGRLLRPPVAPLITARHEPPGSGQDDMKKLLLVTLAAFAATGLIPMASAHADTVSEESSFVSQINALRASKGLATLAVDAGITGKARAWAQTMADKNTIWHSTLSDGVTADWQKLGENVGMGASVDSLETAFVNSPHHYANLVDPAFRSIGLGVVHSDTGILFVSEVFMVTRTAASVPAPVALPAVTSVVLATAVTAPAAAPTSVQPAKRIVAAKPLAATTTTTSTTTTQAKPGTVTELAHFIAGEYGQRDPSPGEWIRDF